MTNKINNLPDATLINEGTKLPVVAWRYLSPTGWHVTASVQQALHINDLYPAKPLTTIAAATEAIERAEQRLNFKVTAAQSREAEHLRRIAELEAKVAELEPWATRSAVELASIAGNRIAELEAELNTWVKEFSDERAHGFILKNHIGKLEAVLQQAQVALHATCQVPCYDGHPLQEAALAAIDALGVK